ncbi:MAG: hypothetical protein AMK75_03040 [Planctomycetes bacterium SM23_65]|nr:MAG: hypothetical protein AMK75_03040 [Planctomycetes bacterium SM23_65]
MPRKRNFSSLWVILLALLFAAPAWPADWPMWRHDAKRSAASDEQLAAELHLQWVRKYSPVRPTWPGAPRQLFDPVYQPVVRDKTMLLCLNRSDKLVALDVDTGVEKWSFFADAPVRFAPACWQGRVFVGSDDGYLYCLDAVTGKLIWRFRGGPSDRRLIGHDRLISTWPVSSGPVVTDGTVYFSAGLWPFMDVFYHALDAETGKVVWTNDETSFLFRAMPKGHSNATALSGPTPQGYAVVAGDRLLIPCGRSLPACFDRRTGKFLYYEPTAAAFYGRVTARTNCVVSATGDYFFNGLGVFELATGKLLREMAPVSVLTDDAIFAGGAAYDPTRSQVTEYLNWRKEKLRKLTVPKLYDLPAGSMRIKAGRRLYGDSPGRVFAVELPEPGNKPKVSWSVPMKETVGDILAADGKLFVVTKEGGIHCFAPEKVEPKTLGERPEPLPTVEDQWTRKAAELLRLTDPVPGYAVVLGIDSGRLVEELVRQSKFHVIGIDSDAAEVGALRRKLDAAGLYGERVSLHVGDPAPFALPPYFARLIVVGNRPAVTSAFTASVFRSLRPYGGSACFATSAARHAALTREIEKAKLPGAEVKRSGGLTVLSRVGPLEGAGTWTHDNADAGRRTFSTDRHVKAPLGVLWFGGEAGGSIFRQGNYPAGPSPLVLDGRMILQGIHSLYAVDVYSGRILWKTPLAPADDPASPTRDIGYLAGNARYMCYTQALASDAFYIGWGRLCRVFDPATGKETAAWKMPTGEANARWGNLLLVGDVLVSASCTPVDLQKLPVDQEKLSSREVVRVAEWVEAMWRIRALPTPPASKAAEGLDQQLGKLLGPKPLAEKFARYKTHAIAAPMEHAERIFAVNRKTGKLLWTYECTYGCQHNSALVAGGGKVFLVDAYRNALAGLLRKRGKLPEDYAPKLVALDVRTGSMVWSETDSVWGVGGLGYAPQQDLILQAGGRASRYRVARKAQDGSFLWKKRMHCEAYGWYHPSIIADDVIMSYLGDVYDLKSGQRKTIAHPLTGEQVPWTLFTRSHGCNHAVASENLVTVRVGNAAYVDLLNFSGTHSLGGFRSGCQNSLIVADGVLSAPRYSGCSCAYPIFTSLGLVHDPEVEQWSFFGRGPVRGRVKRVGINLGAPGDRRTDDGTLWLDYPSVGGPSPDIPVRVTPENVERFCHRSSRVKGDGLRWVAASGLKGLREVTVTLAPDAKDEQRYTVRLHFCEPDDVKPGQRVFSVALQGKPVLGDFDVVREAGGPNRTLIRTFRDVSVKSELTIVLSPSEGTDVPAPILSGVEIIAE